MPPSQQVFASFSQEWEELLLQTIFLAVVSSFGNLSIKTFFRSDQPFWLQSWTKGGCWEEWQPP